MFAADGLIEKALERVVPQHADDERSCGVGKGCRRPIDELREVEQEDGLQVRLGGLPRLRSEEHTSELQSQSNLVCRLLLEKKKDDCQDRPLVLATSLSRKSATK